MTLANFQHVITKATARQKLRWAIDFSQMNLKEAKKGVLIDAQDELKELLQCSISDDDFLDAQRRFKKHFLEMVADFESGGGIVDYEFAYARGSITASPTSPTYRYWVESLFLRDRVFSALGSLITTSEVEFGQLRACPDSKCRRIFLLERKPHAGKEYHCSIRCARRAAVRRYRAKEEGKIKERRRGQTRYEKKVRKKYPNAPMRRKRASAI